MAGGTKRQNATHATVGEARAARQSAQAGTERYLRVAAVEMRCLVWETVPFMCWRQDTSVRRARRSSITVRSCDRRPVQPASPERSVRPTRLSNQTPPAQRGLCREGYVGVMVEILQSGDIEGDREEKVPC